jgi:phosphoribosylformylglycinamidine synthase
VGAIVAGLLRGPSLLRRHPSRSIAGTVGSWWPKANGEKTPWFRMFENARGWVK